VKKLFIWGGIAAGVVLLAMGIGSIVVGASGRSEVRNQIAQEKIVGTPDMSPTVIAGEARKAGLENVDIPSCTVADQAINTGSKARCFADYLRIHTLMATNGQTYAEMPRYIDENGKPTNDEKAAAVDPKTGGPAANSARDIWVTATALSTALNTSYFAEQVSVFSVAMGGAMILVGIGLLVLTLGVLRPRLATAKVEPKVESAGAAPA
jgi:sorbitol-specific phosphotransferase system component IIC